MDLNFLLVVAAMFALQVPFWWVLYLIERYTWNKGFSRLNRKPWKYIKSIAYGCQHKFEAGEHKETFSFRFDK
jgi:hypothetical protein